MLKLLSSSKLAIIKYLLLVVIDVKCSVGVTSTEQDAKSRRSPTDLESREEAVPDARERGEGWDGEQWSVGTVRKRISTLHSQLNSCR